MSIKDCFKIPFISSICRYCILSLLFLLASTTSVFARHHKKKHAVVEQEMTVAAIRPAQNNETFVRVTFLQSQRFYKLPNDSDPKFMARLKASEQMHIPVVIKRETEQSDIILSVENKMN